MLHSSAIDVSAPRSSKGSSEMFPGHDEDMEEKKEDVVYTRNKEDEAEPTVASPSNKDDNALVKSGIEGVQQARQGLMKVLMEHRFHSKFSSTPLSMDTSQNSVRTCSQRLRHGRADSGLLIDSGSASLSGSDNEDTSGITEQERLYLEQLILQGDVATIEAAKERLQDPSLFPKHDDAHASREASQDSTTTSTNGASIGTSKPPMDPTKRRDSKVQQKLFQIHQEKAVQPSKVLQYIQQSKQQNSILSASDDVASNTAEGVNTKMNTTADESTKDDKSHEAITPNTNNRLKSRFQSTAIDDSMSQSNNSIRRQMQMQNSMTLEPAEAAEAATAAVPSEHTAVDKSPHRLRERFQSTAIGDSFNQSTNSMRRSTRISGLTVADDDASWDPMEPGSLDEQDDGDNLPEEQAIDSRKGVEETPTSGVDEISDMGRLTVQDAASAAQPEAHNTSFEDPDPFKDIASWIDGGQGVEVNDSGIPLLGSQKSSSSTTLFDPKQILADPVNEETGARATLPADVSEVIAEDVEQYPHHRNFKILGTSAGDVSCHPHVLSPPLMESLLSFVPEPVMESSNFYLKYSLVRDGANLWTMLRQIRASNPTVLAIETVDGHVFGAFTDNAWRFSVGWYGGSQAFLWKMRHSRLETSRSIVEQAVHESEIQVFPVRPGNVAVQYCSRDCLMLGNGEIAGHVRKPNSTPVATATPAGIASAEAVAAATTTVHTGFNHTPVKGSDDVGSKHYGHGIYLESSLLRGSTSSSETFGNPCLVDEQQRGVKFDVANIEVWTLTPHDNVSEAQQSELSTMFLEGGKPEKDLNLLGILVGGTI